MQAIQECDNGQLQFNLGIVRAFLYGKKWYPLRATLNRAATHANEPDNLTTDRALVQLVYLDVWTRVTDINFQTHLPVLGDVVCLNEEIKKLSRVLFLITN
jgi:hypothetical protein